MWYSVHKDNGHLDSVVDHWTFLPGLMIHNGNAPRGTPTLAPGKYRSPLTSGETQTMLQYLWCKLHVIIIWWGRISMIFVLFYLTAWSSLCRLKNKFMYLPVWPSFRNWSQIPPCNLLWIIKSWNEFVMARYKTFLSLSITSTLTASKKKSLES